MVSPNTVLDSDQEDLQAERHSKVYFKDGMKELFKWQNRFIHQHIDPGDTVLDIGCGVGTLLFGLDKSIDYTGVDTSKNALSTIRERFDTDARLMDAHSLEFPDNSFDKIVFRGTLYHLRDQVKALQEARRVLKPEGKIIVFEGAADGSLYRKIVQFVADYLDPRHEVSSNPHNSVQDITEKSSSAGLETVKIERVPGFAVPFLEKLDLPILVSKALIKVTELSSRTTHWHNLMVLGK